MRLLLLFLFTLFLLSCKEDKKDPDIKSHLQPIKTKAKLKTYAEISIALGGTWTDGKRGHKEYQNGTSFKNIKSLRVPDEHTDHTYYLRYEGPGLESNKIGYRLYLDWRNAIDIFGKTTDEMVLNQVGQDGFESYHKMQPWGMDILKVGKSLGIGSIGRLVKNKVLHFNKVDSTFVVVENASNKSSIKVDYLGWRTGNDKINLKSDLSITPDSRMVRHTIYPSKEISGIVTGIVNHKVTFLENHDSENKWSYMGTYGKQSLVPDNLGMAIFYQTNSVVGKPVIGQNDHLIEFKPTKQSVSYYFLAAWEKEKEGIKTEEEFILYLDRKLGELNN